jgi:HEAT repeat protein
MVRCKMINNQFELEAIYKSAIDGEKEWMKYQVTQSDKSLIKELLLNINKLGYKINYLADLNYRDINDKDIIPIIKKFVGKFEDESISAELISAIGKKGFYEATEFIVEQYNRVKILPKEQRDIYLLCLENALDQIKDKRYIDKYLDIICDESLANNSTLIMFMLAKWKIEKAKPIFIKYLSSSYNELRYSSIQALGYYKDSSLIPLLEPLLDSEDKLNIKFAKKTINKLQKEKG